MSASSSTTSIRALLTRAPSWAPAGALRAALPGPVLFHQAADRRARARRPRRDCPPRRTRRAPRRSCARWRARGRCPAPWSSRRDRRPARSARAGSRGRRPRPRSPRPLRLPASRARVVTRISPPSRPSSASTALVSRLCSNCRSRPWSATISDRRRIERNAEAHAAARDLRAVQVRHLGDELVHVHARHLEPRRTRVLAERVDHLLHRLDLLHDRLRAAVEQLRVLLVQGRQQLVPHALGREADRRERVLDLVREAARDLAPGGLRAAPAACW